MADSRDPRPLGLQNPVVFREIALVGSGSIADVDASPTISVGTGSPALTLTRPQGSIFLRKNGSEDSTIYINTDGAAAWAAVQAGDPAADVIGDANAYYTTDTINGAFDALGLQIGGNDDAMFAFVDQTVVADDDPVYAALDKLDQAWTFARTAPTLTVNAEAANVIAVDVSSPVASVERYVAVVWDDATGESAAAVFTLAETGAGAEVSPSARARLIFTTDAAGAATIAIADVAGASSKTAWLEISPMFASADVAVFCAPVAVSATFDGA